MTLPRQVLPGATYLVSRRCAQREFLLKPTPLTTAIFKYVLAVAAKRYGIQPHALCVMSNHYHLVLSDPRAELPRFTHFLDGVVARALNSVYGRWEAFWAPSSYSAVRLISPRDVLGKIIYTLSNPVFAGLVAHGSEWPGARSVPEHIDARAESIERPNRFFSKTGFMPERESLLFVTPPGFDSPEEFRAQLGVAIANCEHAAAVKRARRGRSPLGVREVLRQKRTSRPSNAAPHRGLRPRVAARDRWKRIEALRRLREFIEAYRGALARLQRGFHDVMFPRGTYHLRVHLRVLCETT